MDALAVIMRVGLGVVLLSAATAKLRDGSGLQTVLRLRPVGPQRFMRFVTRWLPFVEFVVGVLLIAGFLPLVASVAALLLFSAFTVWLIVLFRDPRPLGCACFGASANDPVNLVQIFRNALLIAATVVLVAASDQAILDPAGALDERTTTVDQLLPAFAIVAAVVLTFALLTTLSVVRSRGRA